MSVIYGEASTTMCCNPKDCLRIGTFFAMVLMVANADASKLGGLRLHRHSEWFSAF
jgi:hypothetical protein